MVLAETSMMEIDLRLSWGSALEVGEKISNH